MVAQPAIISETYQNVIDGSNHLVLTTSAVAGNLLVFQVFNVGGVNGFGNNTLPTGFTTVLARTANDLGTRGMWMMYKFATGNDVVTFDCGSGTTASQGVLYEVSMVETSAITIVTRSDAKATAASITAGVAITAPATPKWSVYFAGLTVNNTITGLSSTVGTSDFFNTNGLCGWFYIMGTTPSTAYTPTVSWTTSRPSALIQAIFSGIDDTEMNNLGLLGSSV